MFPPPYHFIIARTTRINKIDFSSMACAQEALAGYLLTLLEENRELAPPSDMSAVPCDGDSFVTLVTCEPRPLQYGIQ